MQPHQVVYAPAPVQTPPQRKHGCAFKTLGILQIVVAGISVLFGGANIAFTIWAIIAYPIWGGLLFYLPAGILCILVVVVSATSRKCLAIACMVMCILSAVAAGVNIIFDGLALGLTGLYSYHFYEVTASLNSILLITAVAELVVASVASAYCCLILSQETSAPVMQYVVAGQPNAAMYNQAAIAGYPTGNQSFMVSQPAANTVNQVPPQYQAFGGAISENQAFEKQSIVD